MDRSAFSFVLLACNYLIMNTSFVLFSDADGRVQTYLRPGVQIPILA